MPTTPLELALSYIAVPWPVFPCRNADEVTDEYDTETGEVVVYKAKTPLVSNGFRGATLSERIVRELWSRNPEAAIGIPTGSKTNVFVLDIDVKSGVNGFDWLREQESLHGDLPETAKASTPSGGVHYYFKYVENTRNRGALGAGVDIRSEGGYVLAPGSVMATGKSYQWLDFDGPGIPPIADAPQWLLDLVVRKAAPPATTGGSPAFSSANSAYVEKAVQAELDETAAVPMGAGRNIRLNAAAFSLGTFVGAGALLEHEARSMLQDVARGWGRDYKQCCKTIENGLKAGILQPREIPEAEYRDIPTDPEVVRRVIERSKAKKEAAADDAAHADEPANDNEAPTDEDETLPVDPWAERARPSLPKGLLPPLIEDLSFAQAEIMGVDPGGIAAAALAVCAAAIPDDIQLKVKRHANWFESARLWVALIGNPSAKKTPMVSMTAEPLRDIDFELAREYNEARAEYDGLSTSEKKSASPPPRKRRVIEDATMEAAQEILKDSPDGVLLVRDELSGWFGSMEKYASERGSSAERAFWLQSFNGGKYNVDRVGRGSTTIGNLSISLIGGIQPEPIRKIASEAQDDGLLQRLCPVVLGQASVGQDVEKPPVVALYQGLVHRLNTMSRPKIGLCETNLQFDEEAQELRNKLEEEHHSKRIAWEQVDKRVATHIGKYDGLFARLCVVWHCIEADCQRPDVVVGLATAERVAAFLRGFLFPHALSFYGDIIGTTDKKDSLLATASYILAHRLEKIDRRTVRHGDRAMRSLKDWEVDDVLNKLDALGWLDLAPLGRNEVSQKWLVRPIVHTIFADRAEAEAKRRLEIRKTIAESLAA